MDSVRVARSVQAATVVKTDLFPDISIGDAAMDSGNGG
jgi:hypothetical protein